MSTFKWERAAFTSGRAMYAVVSGQGKPSVMAYISPIGMHYTVSVFERSTSKWDTLDDHFVDIGDAQAVAELLAFAQFER